MRSAVLPRKCGATGRSSNPGDAHSGRRFDSARVHVGVALDETIVMSDRSLQVRRRVDRLLTELAAIAPPGRRESLQARIERA
jgi:hypothetical protein